MTGDAATPDRGEATILLSEFEDVSERLRDEAKKRDRHFLWAGLGASPALLPLLIGVSGYGLYAVLGASALFSIVEAGRGRVAMLRVRELERLAAERRAEWMTALGSRSETSAEDGDRRTGASDPPVPGS